MANDRAIDLLAPVPGEHVLEIGFGPGRTIGELAARGARVTGIDVSPAMLAQTSPSPTSTRSGIDSRTRSARGCAR